MFEFLLCNVSNVTNVKLSNSIKSSVSELIVVFITMYFLRPEQFEETLRYRSYRNLPLDR